MSEKGSRYPCFKLIASHVVDLVDDLENRQKDKQLVLAIPNQLDEFGQEVILGELVGRGYENPMLLWRPVAAALSWLDKVEGDFIPKKMHPDDHIHVVYLGTDAIEFTTFRLRPWKHDGLFYILPLRDREKDPPAFTGLDWAGWLIKKIMPDIEEGAYWQLLSIFPDIWKAIAGKNTDARPAQRALSSSGKWTLWSAPSEMRNKIYSIKRGACGVLRKILDPSFKLAAFPEYEIKESVNCYLKSQLLNMAKKFPKGNPRGIIVAGPLVENGIPAWFEEGLDSLKARGLKIGHSFSEPEIDTLWLCPHCNDPVAEGAYIYGKRTLKKIPAYLDTMPQLSILAKENARFKWVPLLNAQEVLGGEEHTDRISGKFQLQKGQNTLEAYLCKGPIKEAQRVMEESSDPMAVPVGKIPPCQARVVREAVRQLGSLRKVLSDSHFQDGEALHLMRFDMPEHYIRKRKTYI